MECSARFYMQIVWLVTLRRKRKALHPYSLLLCGGITWPPNLTAFLQLVKTEFVDTSATGGGIASAGHRTCSRSVSAVTCVVLQ